MIDRYLDHQYDLRARHPQHQRFKDEWARRSEQARKAHRCCRLDLPCGHAPGATFDLFPVNGEGRAAPCLIFLHGGFWRSSDKADCSFVGETLNAAGIATVVLNHTLLPARGLAAIIEEVRDSVAFIHATAEELGVDRSRLFIGGHSSGAHLAALIMATNWSARGIADDPLRGGFGLSGLYDPTPLVSTRHNRPLGLTESDARSLSALHRPAGARRLPLVACGVDEPDEFKRQSLGYAATTHPDEPDVLWLARTNHYEMPLELDDYNSLLTRTVVRMIDDG